MHELIYIDLSLSLSMCIYILTEAEHGRQGSQTSIANALRNSKASNGDSCNEISFEEVEGVSGGPFEDGDEVVQSQYEFSCEWLLLQLLEGIIWE